MHAFVVSRATCVCMYEMTSVHVRMFYSLSTRHCLPHLGPANLVAILVNFIRISDRHHEAPCFLFGLEQIVPIVTYAPVSPGMHYSPGLVFDERWSKMISI